MDTNSNKRRDNRLKHRASIKFTAGNDIEMTLDMRDFSDSGLYLYSSDTSIVEVGSEVEVQTLEIEDAPVLPSIVKRIEDNVGFAVEFILD